jgi:hypothetical protein
MRNRKPTYQVRASAVNSVSHKLGSLIAVVASADFALPKSQELAAFGCKHCGTTVAALKDSEPFCITCGSDQVDLDDEADLAPEELNETQELSGIICAGCNTHNILTDVVAAKLAGKMHCITCGDALEFDQPAVGADDGDDLPEVNPVGQDDADALDDVQIVDEAAGADDVDTGPEGEVSLDGDDATTAGHGDGADEDLHPPVDADTPGTMTAPYEAPEGAETVDVSMADVVPEDVSDEFDVSADDEAMVATVNHVPVARLMREQAGDYADMWGKHSFLRAIVAAVETEGREAALAHFGFEPIIAKFPLKKLVDSQVATALAAEKTRVQASIDNTREDYKHGLAIAAAGLQKGFFKGYDHPLKAALFEELQAAGVRAPAKMIDRVFRAQGSAFMGTLLALAEEVMAKPLEVRNELASSVDSANYIAAASDEDGDDVADDADTDSEDEDSDDVVESATRMQTHAGVRITRKQPAEVASIREMTRGRRLFGA